jgi:ubiquinone/menaquinone biosynthesis C-methylase UbiE
MADQEYVFDRTKELVELDRLRLLESAFDPLTRMRLENVGVAAGWHCLEVGAGAGSIMGWLSERVGPTGNVVAIDTNTRFLPSSLPSNTTIVKGDIRDVDLGGSRFDLIHGRYVLLHLPDFVSIIKKMISLLTPRGWLVFEEPDFSAARFLCGSEEEHRTFGRVMQAIEIMYETLGIDHTTGLKIPKVVSALGIKKLFVDNYAPASPGNSSIARMMGMSAEQLKERYVQTQKCTPEDIDIYRSFAEDPGTWAVYYSTVCISGQKET